MIQIDSCMRPAEADSDTAKARDDHACYLKHMKAYGAVGNGHMRSHDLYSQRREGENEMDVKDATKYAKSVPRAYSLPQTSSRLSIPAVFMFL